MAKYKAYSVDRNGDITGPASCFECPADEDALERARTEIDAYAVELWAEDRRVGFAIPNPSVAKAG